MFLAGTTYELWRFSATKFCVEVYGKPKGIPAHISADLIGESVNSISTFSMLRRTLKVCNRCFTIS